MRITIEFSPATPRPAAPMLSETERRRIWNGHNGADREDPRPTVRARIGRDFLRAIGQEPRWDQPGSPLS